MKRCHKSTYTMSTGFPGHLESKYVSYSKGKCRLVSKLPDLVVVVLVYDGWATENIVFLMLRILYLKYFAIEHLASLVGDPAETTAQASKPHRYDKAVQFGWWGRTLMCTPC